MMANIRDLFIFIILTASQAFSQNLETSLIKGLPSNLSPGSKNTIVFRITNHNDFSVTLYTKLSSPLGWRLFFNETVTVQENSIAILPIGVMIPLATEPGLNQIILELSDPKINYKETINVDTQILKNIDIEVKLVDAPKFILAGREISTDFSIYNKSNNQRKVFLQSTHGTLNGSNSITLEIGESKVINVICPTVPDLIANTKQLVDLIVSSGPYQNSDKTYVMVIPTKGHKIDKYHRLSSEFSTTYLYRGRGNDEYSGFQGELYSNGSLDSKNKHRLELRARGPDQFDNSILGLYNEYFINYHSKYLHLLLGDNTFSLTPLTEYGRYGTGVMARYDNQKYDIGLFYMQPRFYPEYDQEIAGFLNFKFDENNLGLTYLQKHVANSGEHVNLYSALYKINPFEHLSMDVEYSLGKLNDKLGQGYSLELSNRTKKTVATASFINADQNFPGYYNNTSYLNGNFQYLISKNLKFFTNFHQDESNALRDTLYGVSPYSQYIIAGFAYSYRTQDFANLYIGTRERKDRMPLKKFHYSENYLRIALGNNIRNLQSSVSWEMANTSNYLTKNNGRSYKGSIAIRYKPLPNLYISPFIQYYNTYRYSESSLQEIIYGAESLYNFNSKTQLNLSFQNSHNVEEYYRNRSLVDFRLTKYISQKHEINFLWSETLKQKQIENRDRFIGLKYTFHFGVPLKKTKNLGSLRGRFINRGVKDISNVMVNLGGSVQVSDQDGVFLFPDVPTGEQPLYIDTASMDFNDIPNVKIPMVVNIEQDKLTDIQIELTKAGIISGSVLLNFEDETTEHLALGDMEIFQNNVIIELQLDNEFHRSVVYLNKKFVFTGLRPGDWKLKVYPNSLGNNFTIKNSDLIVNLKAGETSTIIINVIKKARRIRFQPTEIIIK